MKDSVNDGETTANPRQVDGGGSMEEIRFTVPGEWKRALEELARVQSVALADVMRISTRGFLRERYTADEQKALGI